MAPLREELAAAAKKAEAEARATLWSLAFAISNVKAIILLTLDLEAGNYLTWRRQFEIALTKYELDEHIAEPDATGTTVVVAAWRRHDALVLSWMYGSISAPLQSMLRSSSSTTTACSVWQEIEDLHRDNTDTCAVLLEEEFYSLQQGDLSMADYCRKIKGLVDELVGLGVTIADRNLVRKTLRGLNPQYANMRQNLGMRVPLPSFIELRSALLLEDMCSGQSSAHSAFYASGNSLTKENDRLGASSIVVQQADDSQVQEINCSTFQ